MTWVHMRHPETGGEGLFPDSPDVLDAHEARGWIRSDAVPEHLDPDAPNRGQLATSPRFAPHLEDELAVELAPAEDPAPEAPEPAAPASGKAPKTAPAAAASVDTTGE